MRVLLRAAVCTVMTSAPLSAQQSISLVGSGSSVPNPLFRAWAEQYGKLNPKVQVRYLQLGASEGMRQIRQGVGDFAAGEIPLTPAQLHGEKSSLVQVPTVLVAIVPIYNLPGEPGLKFSGELLADILLGDVKNWKDERIAKLNPGAELPDLKIVVIHRSSGKGSNYILTDFLSKVSPQWKSRIGKSASPMWRVGEETNRSEDMVEKVVGTPGAIGYVELNYAQRKDLGTGTVQNSAGRFIQATPLSIAAACAVDEKAIQSDFGASLTNASGKDSYPIVSFTSVYLPASGAEPARIRAVKDFLSWALTSGQETANSLGYTVLPAGIAARAREALNSIQ